MAAPTQKAFLDPQALARLSQHQLGTRFPMVGSVTGHHKSPHRGSSVEFAEYRKYVPGDDIRRLDWRVYARTDRFYMKEFEADTNLRCHLVVDCSASMKFQAGDRETKFNYARRLAAALAYLAVQQGDAVGLVCLGARVLQEVPPRRNPTHLQTVFETLDKAAPTGETGLVTALHDLAERIRQRALVVIFSDFFCPAQELIDAFQHLRFQKHDLALFHLLDPQELEFPFDRPTRFVDLESPGSVLAEPAMIRAQYLQQVQDYLEALGTGCRQFKADYRRVLTSEDYEKVLGTFLMERAVTQA